MALLTGMTPDGQEVPVQVTPDGRLVAEGLTGPAGPEGPAGPQGPQGATGQPGPAGVSDWNKNGADINYKDGRVLVGMSSARSNFNNTTNTAIVQVEGTTLNNSSVSITRNQLGSSPGCLIFAKSRSDSLGSNALVASGDSLGQISFEGSDGAEFVRAATIIAAVDGTPGANDMPGRLVFLTAKDGASSPSEAMRIDSQQRVCIKSPGGSWWALQVSDAGALSAVAV